MSLRVQPFTLWATPRASDGHISHSRESASLPCGDRVPIMICNPSSPPPPEPASNRFCSLSHHRMARLQSAPLMVTLLLIGFAMAKVDNIIHEVRFAEPYRSDRRHPASLASPPPPPPPFPAPSLPSQHWPSMGVALVDSHSCAPPMCLADDRAHPAPEIALESRAQICQSAKRASTPSQLLGHKP